MAAKSRSEELAERAQFVFQGTIKQVRATTLREVPVSAHTIVGRIDRVIHAPEALSDSAGQDVTVQLAPGERVEAGQMLIFYTRAVHGLRPRGCSFPSVSRIIGSSTCM